MSMRLVITNVLWPFPVDHLTWPPVDQLTHPLNYKPPDPYATDHGPPDSTLPWTMDHLAPIPLTVDNLIQPSPGPWTQTPCKPRTNDRDCENITFHHTTCVVSKNLLVHLIDLHIKNNRNIKFVNFVSISICLSVCLSVCLHNRISVIVSPVPCVIVTKPLWFQWSAIDYLNVMFCYILFIRLLRVQY